MNPRRHEALAAVAVAAAAGAVLLARTHALELLGFDTYPQIASSRVLDFSDFVGTFTESTSDGVYPYSFYRPLFNLSLAADYALWGLEPFGYHLTDAALTAACGLATFLLVRRLLGPGAHVGPWTALVGFLLLPVHIEVMPLVSRRMDLLCGLLSALALASHARALEGSRRALLCAPLLTLLATSAKESGVVVVPLVFMMTIFRRPRAGPGERVRAAASAALPHLVAIAVVFGARFAALGELGGHPTTNLAGAVTRLPWALGRMLIRISGLGPTQGSPGFWLSSGIGLAAALPLVALVVALLRGEDSRRRGLASDGAARAELSSAGVAACWLLGLAAIQGAVGMLQPWHLLVPCQAFVVGVAALAQRSTASLRQGARPAAVIGLFLVAGWLGLAARDSPLLRTYTHWERASARLEEYLDGLARDIGASPDGTVLEVRLPPIRTPSDPNRIGAVFATAIQVYSLPSWARLRIPERRIVFRHKMLGDEGAEPVPGALVVWVRPRPGRDAPQGPSR